MLQNLSEQVRNCLQHAEDCAHRAKVEPDPNLQRDYLMMERRWLSLARAAINLPSSLTYSRSTTKNKVEK